MPKPNMEKKQTYLLRSGIAKIYWSMKSKVVLFSVSIIGIIIRFWARATDLGSLSVHDIGVEKGEHVK